MKGFKFCACIFRYDILGHCKLGEKIPHCECHEDLHQLSVHFRELHFEIIFRFFQILETVRKLEFSVCSSTSLNHSVSSMKVKSTLIIKYKVSETLLGEFCIISSILLNLADCFLNFDSMSVAETISVATTLAKVTPAES